MLSIHPQARTTPAVRQEIARSPEPTGVLAKRFGVSTETIRKWRQRGADDCKDHSSRPHKLPWKATEEERAIVWDPSQTFCFRVSANAAWVQGRRVACSRVGILIVR
jgi:hypothetical protein